MLGRRTLFPPTLIPLKKTIKAIVPLLQHGRIEEKRGQSGLTMNSVQLRSVDRFKLHPLIGQVAGKINLPDTARPAEVVGV